MTNRWRGLKALVQDAVEQASHAIERVQKRTAARSFDVLEQIPPIAAPAHGARTIHDAAVTGVHGAIRLVTRVVGHTLDVAIDLVERQGGDQDDKGDKERG